MNGEHRQKCHALSILNLTSPTTSVMTFQQIFTKIAQLDITKATAAHA